MHCKFCGFDNLSDADNCLNCGEIIQSGEINARGQHLRKIRDDSPSKNHQSKMNQIQSLLANNPVQPKINLVQSLLANNLVQSLMNLVQSLLVNKKRDRVTDMSLVDPVGQVYGFSQQEELLDEYKNLVWKFRVHVFDQNGQVKHRLLVEMRGESFTGIINDGDVVRLPGRWRANEVISPDEVINTTLRIKVCESRRASKLAGTQRQSVLNPVGQINGFSQQTEMQTPFLGQGQEQLLVWRFQVQMFDGAGNLIYQIPVEFRGKQFTGAVANGDVVKLSGQWHQGEVFKPKEILNQTLGIQIRASFMTSWQRAGTFAGGIFILFIFMPIFAGIAISFGRGVPSNAHSGIMIIVPVVFGLIVPLFLTVAGINILWRAWRGR